MNKRSFPIYRKLLGGKHLYRIQSGTAFTELQLVGTRWIRHDVEATMYPEMVRITEMIQNGEGRYEDLPEAAWAEAESTLG